MEEAPELSSLNLTALPETRWMLKVVSGPNSGAEFHMQAGGVYVIGKDAATCDVVFQDLSVSRQHARISLDDAGNVFIEDLGSRNGTLINGTPVAGKQQLASQDMVSLGTTTFLIIDREQPHVTIVSAPAVAAPKKAAVEEAAAVKEVRDWREMIIPKRHLILLGVFGFILLISFVGIVSLFQSEPIVTTVKHEGEKIREIIKKYPDVQFSYNEGSGKLFLTGHVLTNIEKQELSYQLKGLPFLRDIEDSVVIDEFVWENMNALLVTNPDWQGISIHSPAPGRFVLRGYLQTPDQAAALSDYINMNFPYLDRLDNQVVIENNLMTLVESQLLEQGFNNVTYQLANGELVLSGRVDGNDQSKFESLVSQFKTTRGVRSLKNYVIFTTEESSLVDLTSKYRVMGYSKKDGENQFVVVNGRILTMGDILDGMMITGIQPNVILLEKDGLKFKINYNLQ
jgi:type III secretion system YscD/HrpQ family protein